MTVTVIGRHYIDSDTAQLPLIFSYNNALNCPFILPNIIIQCIKYTWSTLYMYMKHEHNVKM